MAALRPSAAEDALDAQVASLLLSDRRPEAIAFLLDPALAAQEVEWRSLADLLADQEIAIGFIELTADRSERLDDDPLLVLGEVIEEVEWDQAVPEEHLIWWLPEGALPSESALTYLVGALHASPRTWVAAPWSASGSPALTLSRTGGLVSQRHGEGATAGSSTVFDALGVQPAGVLAKSPELTLLTATTRGERSPLAGMDLGWRAQRAGGRIVTVPAALLLGKEPDLTEASAGPSGPSADAMAGVAAAEPSADRPRVQPVARGVDARAARDWLIARTPRWRRFGLYVRMLLELPVLSVFVALAGLARLVGAGGAGPRLSDLGALVGALLGSAWWQRTPAAPADATGNHGEQVRSADLAPLFVSSGQMRRSWRAQLRQRPSDAPGTALTLARVFMLIALLGAWFVLMARTSEQGYNWWASVIRPRNVIAWWAAVTIPVAGLVAALAASTMTRSTAARWAAGVIWTLNTSTLVALSIPTWATIIAALGLPILAAYSVRCLHWWSRALALAVSAALGAILGAFDFIARAGSEAKARELVGALPQLWHAGELEDPNGLARTWQWFTGSLEGPGWGVLALLAAGLVCLWWVKRGTGVMALCWMAGSAAVLTVAVRADHPFTGTGANIPDLPLARMVLVGTALMLLLDGTQRAHELDGLLSRFRFRAIAPVAVAALIVATLLANPQWLVSWR